MRRYVIAATTAMAILALSAPALVAQNQDQDQGRGNRGREGFDRGGDRGGRGGDRGGRDRGRGGWDRRPPGEWTDQDRERFYNEMTERYLRDAEETYTLTDAQKQQVEAKLDALKEQHKAYSQPFRQEFQGLMQEMGELMRARFRDEPVDEVRMQQIRDRMEQLRDASPLMNRDSVYSQVESILPADQVKAGQARRDQRRQEMRQRMERWRQEREQRGDNRGGPGGFFGGDRWDGYVERFTAHYMLDDAQKASAQSVLRTLKQQRDQQLEAAAGKRAEIAKNPDVQQRLTQYRELNAPVEGLYQTLQQKLEEIPTTAQKTLAGPMNDGSRRRGGDNNEASPDSRPADNGDNGGQRGRDRGGRDRGGRDRNRTGNEPRA